MTIKPIKTEADYREALKRLEMIFDAAIGTVESDEADVLGLMVDEYEKKKYPIESPDSIVAIKIRMEEMHLKQINLVDAIGGKSRVSEVLNRKRKLTVEIEHDEHVTHWDDYNGEIPYGHLITIINI